MKIKLNNLFIVILLFALLVSISGLDSGCGGSSNAQKTGVDFSLIQRQDTLYSGKTLQLGETFYVGVRLENYDKVERQVEICIEDTVLDQYQGITSSQGCQQESLPAAEIIKTESSGAFSSSKETLTPGVKEVFFPQQGQFSYKGLQSMNKVFPSNLIVTVRYPETTRATTAVYVPDTEQPALTQDPSQIMAYMTKSVYPQGNAYKVSLDITLRKNSNSQIFLQDFQTENKTYFDVRLASQMMACTTTNGVPVTNTLEIKNDKTVRCSTTVYQGAQRQDYDLAITMMYGVVLKKTYGFSIQTSQEA